MKKPRKLPTRKQKNFVKEYVKSGNGAKAVVASYETENLKSAAVIAHRNLNSPPVQEYMQKILDSAGLSDKFIAEGLYKITKAGLSSRSLKKVDPQDSLRAFDMGLKLRDRYPVQKKRIESLKVNVDLVGKSTEELEKILGTKVKEANFYLNKLKKDNREKKKRGKEKKLVVEAKVVETKEDSIPEQQAEHRWNQNQAKKPVTEPPVAEATVIEPKKAPQQHLRINK